MCGNCAYVLSAVIYSFNKLKLCLLFCVTIHVHEHIQSVQSINFKIFSISLRIKQFKSTMHRTIFNPNSFYLIKYLKHLITKKTVDYFQMMTLQMMTLIYRSKNLRHFVIRAHFKIIIFSIVKQTHKYVQCIVQLAIN